MILIDTSVVIDYLRSGDPRLLALFQVHDAAICGVTRAEVLWGTRSTAHQQDLLDTLDSFIQVLIPESLWDAVGGNLAALRSRGVTVPFQDVVIATVAVANDIELWTRDNQFRLIQGVLPQLRLFQEPP
ncbi:MAG: PIN domain-containing protein [Gemmataceae bacterium]